jgi:ribosome-interacting GTPase 1
MPANLTPQYLEAEKRYREAKDPSDKLDALKEMLTVIPKHKGTEKLQGDIKKRIAKIQNRVKQKEKVARRGALYQFDKEGAGQVVLIGAPNSGKSTIVSSTTRATTEVAEYPYSTWSPTAGMMLFEDIQFQLIDTPPLSEEHNEPWLFDIIRRADIAMLVVDIGDKPLVDIETCREILEQNKILLTGRKKKDKKGFIVKKTIIAGNKFDLPDSPENADILRELYGDTVPMLFISAIDKKSLEFLKIEIFKFLDIVRIYTKIPGKKPDFDRPYVAPIGSTVHDIAAMVHKEIASSMVFARIWGEDKEGIRIPKDYQVRDREILEFHS